MEKKPCDLGKEGEQQAVDYLLDAGYQIIDRNFVCGKNEVDIIATDGQSIVFVEVKTRATHAFGEPEQAVTKAKQKLIIRVADAYITKFNVTMEARFDVISIVLNGEGKPEINHIPSAFEPSIC
ncbi:MAG: YraN family protein [Bacteroidales bacterium]|jgi:putative endonuclease|nr:YraN family protein [Bacteroidales bacterium]